MCGCLGLARVGLLMGTPGHHSCPGAFVGEDRRGIVSSRHLERFWLCSLGQGWSVASVSVWCNHCNGGGRWLLVALLCGWRWVNAVVMHQVHFRLFQPHPLVHTLIPVVRYTAAKTPYDVVRILYSANTHAFKKLSTLGFQLHTLTLSVLAFVVL